MALKLTSTAFPPGGDIPSKFTCEGQDISPPLAWSGLPTGTKSLALIMDDPDAPDPAAPKMTYVHWVLYNIPMSANGLAEGVKDLPAGSLNGLNDRQRTGYWGPCPPIGQHRYFFKLYALDTVLPDLSSPTKAQLEAVIKGGVYRQMPKSHVIESAELMGTYQKPPTRCARCGPQSR